MTAGPVAKTDALSVAAIAIIAMLVVTFDHEALGHGGMCLALGGQITRLTSSLFRCSVPSALIDPAGPITNLFVGTLALVASRLTPPNRPGLSLFLLLVTSMSYFWEGGYVVQAMWEGSGDLYFAGRNYIGEPSLWWRISGAGLGVALFLLSVRLTSQTLLSLWPRNQARVVAQIAWMASTSAAVLAALVYKGGIGKDLHDAFMEIGAASILLLVLPVRSTLPPPQRPMSIRRSWPIAIFALLAFATFTLTMGRGIGTIALD